VRLTGNAQFNGEPDQIGRPRNTQLTFDLTACVSHRLVAHAQSFGDFVEASAFAQKAHDFQVALGELTHGIAADVLDRHVLRDDAFNIPSAIGDLLNGRQQLLRRRVLADVPLCARL